jgi:hypothetical protein
VCRICPNNLAKIKEEIWPKEQPCKNLSTPNKATSGKKATEPNNHRLAKLHRKEKR